MSEPTDRDHGEPQDDEDSLADEMSEQSFPTSDPPSTWAGADESDQG